MNVSDIAKQLGSLGGKKSVDSRFKGKTKEEISEIMSKVRLTKQLKNAKK
jgi:copper chaperone CopZ